MELIKKYKNYLIALGILILGILIGNLSSGGDNAPTTHEDGKHEFVQDPETKIWTCSMHPQIKMDKPGNCPICGMELIPLEEGSDNSSENIASNEIVMTEEAIQLANIQTTVVQKANAAKTIHLLGRVKPDERKLFSQVSHIPGRIERLYVNFTGDRVYKGQKIVRIYSPDLITAQKELFEAIKSKDVYPQLYTASRNKLKLWKLSDAQIEAIEKSGNVQEQIDILADHSGYVIKRNVELGDYVMAGQTLFEIANLSSVWVMFEAYESDIPWININDKVTFTIRALPGKTFTGKVTYVDPFVSPETRVAKVRVELNNPDGKLLPEMYANGVIEARLKNVQDAIVIPKSAVLWTGKRAVVYVKVPHEKTTSFVYREVKLGQDMGEFYIVDSGLEAGEVVATNGVFRIDASAQLVGQKSMMNPEGGVAMTGHNHGGMDMGEKKQMEDEMRSKESMDHSEMPDDTDHSRMEKRLDVSKAFTGQLEKVFDNYLGLKDALVKDNANSAKKRADELLASLKKVDMKLLTDHEAHNHWMTISKEIKSSGEAIGKTSDIEKQRGHFKHLSAHLSKGVRLFGVNKEVYEQFCPMADNNQGAYWLSLEEEIKNPYMGSKMLTCGTTESTIVE
ncbi:MAG: efflux transporter periplasmic adaptor subunit [Muricauda sp.]|nr:efflux RND transporter periplasmic adaptor subunit [Allomuricauda sp.]MBC32201.1 efflux transporter periplasmic adaptor subunit [Allomuricauda sp.]|tara:strand:+ start:1452 stop:3317 length:1866 start_codon:yes stop_codon:yes gene_type:complete